VLACVPNERERFARVRHMCWLANLGTKLQVESLV
jgi:hypothetical protein